MTEFRPDYTDKMERPASVLKQAWNPDFTSVGFVLWIPACAGMTNRSKAEGLNSSKVEAVSLIRPNQTLFVRSDTRYYN
jgi:hypothetical protein